MAHFPQTAAAPADDGAALLDRLATREQLIGQQERAARTHARAQARAAYRLVRQRELGFARDIENRRRDAQALDLALLTLARTVGEARILGDELTRLRQERRSLEAHAARPTADEPPALPRARAAFAWPVRGPVVGHPGLRRDPASNTELENRALEILARMNESVDAPAAGAVRRVELLPQGGFAVVLEHTAGWTSVVSGLRDIAVAAGEVVARGQPLGLAGRNLDGAPVISWELWRGRTAVDPRFADATARD